MFDFIRLPVDGAGKRLATVLLPGAGPGGVDLHSEFDQTDICLESPARSSASASVAAGATEDLDGLTIPLNFTGKLVSVIVSASVAAKWVIVSRDGGVEVELGTLFTSGIHGGRPTEVFSPPSKRFCSLDGSGVDENFRVKVTNLDAKNTADCYATFFIDEVEG